MTKEIVQEVDELVAGCDDLGADGSEIVEAILTAFIQTESDHAQRVRERERDHNSETKGYSLTCFVTRAPSARYSKLITIYKHMEYDYSVATVL